MSLTTEQATQAFRDWLVSVTELADTSVLIAGSGGQGTRSYVTLQEMTTQNSGQERRQIGGAHVIRGFRSSVFMVRAFSAGPEAATLPAVQARDYLERARLKRMDYASRLVARNLGIAIVAVGPVLDQTGLFGNRFETQASCEFTVSYVLDHTETPGDVTQIVATHEVDTVAFTQTIDEPT